MDNASPPLSPPTEKSINPFPIFELLMHEAITESNLPAGYDSSQNSHFASFLMPENNEQDRKRRELHENG